MSVRVTQHKMSPEEHTWETPAAAVALGEDEVHVWRVGLDRPDVDIAQLAAILSEEERARAARFRSKELRRRYTVARGVLRSILADYGGVPPEAIAFVYGSHGKPELACPADAPLHFNLSYSQDLALVAATRIAPVGVDIEWTKRTRPIDQLVERFFAPGERRDYHSLAEDQRRLAFFHCWTRKEAFAKGLGRGLTLPLHAFEVTLLPEEPAAVHAMEGDADEAKQWRIASLAPADDFVGAVAVRAHDWRLRRLVWSP